MPEVPTNPSEPSLSALLAAPLTTLALVLVFLVGWPAAAGADTESASPAAYVAELMAEQTQGRAVVVNDLLAGEYDLETLEEEIRAEFDRLDVPYHVFVGTDLVNLRQRGFLPALQDRVGEEGLYVYLSEGSVTLQASTTAGVHLPMDEANTVMVYDGPEYSDPLPVVAKAYVDALLDPEVAEHAERARQASYDEDGGSTSEDRASKWREFVDDMNPDSVNGPENAGTLAGMLGGTVLGVGGAFAVLVWRRRGSGRPPAGALWWAGGSVVAAGAIAVTGLLLTVLPEAGPREQAEEALGEALSAPPYVLATDRVDRVVDGWDDDTRVFVDPLTPLGPEVGEELADAVADATVPVYTAVVPLDPDDESEGDAEVLAHALAHTSGRDGVYVVVDGFHGGVDTALMGVDAGVSIWDLNVSMSEIPEGAPVTAAALELLDRLGEARSAPGAAPTVPLAAEFHADAADDGEPSTRAERYHAEGLWPGLLILGPMMGALLWFVCAGVALLLPWSVRWTRATPGRRLRPMARRAADRAVAALDAAGDHPEVDRAVRDLDTALVVLGESPDELDLVGVIVLARRVERRLGEGEGRADGPVCMADPLHGPAEGRGRLPRWDGGRPLSLCRGCLRTPPERRVPLHVRAGGRRFVPHLTLRERTWVSSRYGTKRRLTGESLLEESRAR
ncbi:hypothetical protein ACFWZ7_05615 [Nocardiopsis alba]|uniref:hypothetical protein n=1 Tax=Nocardiopsis alba TaxID=53437 RepID=UPI0036723640